MTVLSKEDRGRGPKKQRDQTIYDMVAKQMLLQLQGKSHIVIGQDDKDDNDIDADDESDSDDDEKQVMSHASKLMKRINKMAEYRQRYACTRPHI